MNRKVATSLFFAALAIRLVVAFVVQPWFIEHGYEHWSWEWNDGYEALAKNLLAHKGYTLDGTSPTASRMPLYPLFLATILKLFGRRAYIPATFVAQSLLLATVVLLCYHLGTRIFNETAGAIAALIYAFHPSAVIYAARCATEALFFFLLAVATTMLVHALKKPKTLVVASSGLCFGLAYLTRPVAFLVLPFAALFMLALHRDKKPAATTLLVFAVSFLPLVPWAVRNYAASQRLVVLSTWGGAPWFHGYYFSDNFFKVEGSRLQLDQDAMKLREKLIKERWPDIEALDGIERELAADEAAYRLTLEAISRKPLRSAWLFVRGTMLAWFANYNRPTIALGLLLFALLFPAFVWTTLKITKRTFDDPSAKLLVAVVIYFDVVHAIIYPHIRYFSAALFCVAVLAGAAYAELLQYTKRRVPWKREPSSPSRI